MLILNKLKVLRKIAKNLIKIFVYLPLHLISILGYTIKRENDIWVFGSYANSFNDNTKYLYLFVKNKIKYIRAIWISGDKKLIKNLNKRGLESYYRWNIKGIMYCLKAKYYFISAYVSDINFWTSKGAIVINLWHGVPLKKIEYDIKKGVLASRYHSNGVKKLFRKIFFPTIFKKPDYMITTSETIRNIFSSAFRISKDNIWTTGYPRNDIFFRDIKGFDIGSDLKLICKLRNLKSIGKRIIIYVPSFRDDGTDIIDSSNVDFNELNDKLKKLNAIMLLKFHVNTPIKIDLSNFGEFINIPNNIDMYPILPLIDLMVTDYSSIYTDYLFLDKPMIFFCFDKDKYIKDRGFYFDYDKMTPGEKVYTFKELLDKLEKGLNADVYKEKRREVRKSFFEHIDGDSCKRIISVFSNEATIHLKKE